MIDMAGPLARPLDPSSGPMAHVDGSSDIPRRSPNTTAAGRRRCEPAGARHRYHPEATALLLQRGTPLPSTRGRRSAPNRTPLTRARTQLRKQHRRPRFATVCPRTAPGTTPGHRPRPPCQSRTPRARAVITLADVSAPEGSFGIATAGRTEKGHIVHQRARAAARRRSRRTRPNERRVRLRVPPT